MIIFHCARVKRSTPYQRGWSGFTLNDRNPYNGYINPYRIGLMTIPNNMLYMKIMEILDPTKGGPRNGRSCPKWSDMGPL